jgi:glyoxylase-like metal-dependent hydrolase (beta-lactamase superfamily II)
MYKIEIPLPKSPLKALNSYLIKAEGRFLTIDTGWNRQECKDEMFSNLRKLNVDLYKTDFFITHLHVDHLGLVANLATDSSTVYFNQKEASIVNADGDEKERRWQEFYGVYLANGFPEDELKRAMENHPALRYGLKDSLNFCILKEGDVIQIGEYSFKCIETPGHSPGHMCLYEPSKKILVAGDHILSDITPNIMFWLEMEDSLGEYLANLEKVYSLDVELVLPGHRNIWNDHRRRIKELQKHHQARLKEVLVALEDGEKTAFQVAPNVTWDIEYHSWELFPAGQKWFAIGETLAHLKYLEEQGMVRRETQESKILFSLA